MMKEAPPPTVSRNIMDFITLLANSVNLYLKSTYRYMVPPEPKSLSEKVVLVTGSAGGIGRQICTQLAGTGAVLVCWDIDVTNNDKFVKELVTRTGVVAYSFQTDISNRIEVKSLLHRVRKDIGDIHVVINNAGIMPCQTFLNQNSASLQKSFEINVLSQFWILQEVLPKMIECNEGHIVTMGSATGIIPTRNLAAYSGTKHALHGFIEALKEEIRHDSRKPDIKFTTVYPYACNTGMMSGIRSYSRFPILVDKILTPEEVAAKLIDGLRRNYEYVYIPKFVGFAAAISRCILPDVVRLGSDYLNCFVQPEHQGSVESTHISNREY